VRLAVLGRGLATRVGRSGVVPEVVASPSTSAGLARTLVERGVVGARCAWFRGNRADREFSATLSAAGAVVTEVEAYRTDLTTRLGPGDADAMRGAEGVVFSSPSAVEAWVALPAAERPDARVVSIGPSTSAAVRACGLEVAAEAGEPSPAGIVSAVIRATVR
jgi:uroporphyrinogen-III synthase